MKNCLKKKIVCYATFIEYAMLVGLVAILVAVAAWAFSKELKELFTASTDKTSEVTSIVKDAKFEKQGAQTK